MEHVLAPVAFALLVLAAGPSPAAAECVAPFAQCAERCDQRTKPGDPQRPQCAQSCISSYRRCERIEQLQSTTGGPVLNQGGGNAPAR